MSKVKQWNYVTNRLFIKVYYISDERSIRVFEYRYKIILYRYHDIKIYINTIDIILWKH